MRGLEEENKEQIILGLNSGGLEAHFAEQKAVGLDLRVCSESGNFLQDALVCCNFSIS